MSPVEFARQVTARYVDPLAEVWLAAAAKLGLTVERRPDAYAATDGRGALIIGTDATLDADDSVAQMIFHELCHALVQGDGAFARPDWGLDNQTTQHAWREHSTLRLQRTLAARHGLTRMFAPTTDYRMFWDALPVDPLADRADPTVIAAIAALGRADRAPWAPILTAALTATAAIVGAAAPHAAPDSLAAGFVAAPPHPTGLPAGIADGRTCGGCAWRTTRDHCRQASRAVDAAWPGCERWEPALDCQTCGACCREAYDAVAVSPRDPVRRSQPGYVVDRAAAPGAPALASEQRYQLRRAPHPGPTPESTVERCAALVGGALVPCGERGDQLTTTRVRCVIYDDRPRTCREFTLGSAHCLSARRKVGLSLG